MYIKCLDIPSTPTAPPASRGKTPDAFPRANLSRLATPNSMRQGLVRLERTHKAVVSRGGPLVVGADGRRVAQDEVGDHAPEHDAAVVVEVRPVALGEVVHLRGLIADGVDEGERRLVQVDVGGRRRLGRRDGREALVVQGVGRVVLGCEDAPCEGRCEELGGCLLVMIEKESLWGATYWCPARGLHLLGKVLQVGLELAQGDVCSLLLVIMAELETRLSANPGLSE